MKHKKSRNNTKKNNTKKNNNTKKKNNKKTQKIILKNKTPLLIRKVSDKISDNLDSPKFHKFFIPNLFNKKNNKTSYSPTINKEIGAKI